MENKVNDTNIDFCYYAVALVDILNQKELLEGIKNLPENQNEEKAFIEILKKTYGTVQGIRNAFDGFLASYARNHDLSKYNNLSKDKRDLMARMLNCGIKKQQFSDTIILYASLEDNLDYLPINNIQALFIALSAALIMTLSIRKIFRGGIEVHIASSNCFEGDEIYGPALYYAYELENKIAQYPRIAIGERLFNFLVGESCIEGNDILSNYRRETAENLKKMVRIDTDGILILDYLGGVIKNQFGEDVINILKDPINKASAFIEEQYIKFRNKKNITYFPHKKIFTFGYLL